MGEEMSFPINSYLNIYPLAVIICTLLYWFLKNKWRYEMINWLYSFNTIVPLFSLLSLIFFVSELFIAWYGQNSYEWYAFSQNRSNVFIPYGWSYWLMLIATYLLPQLFWFRKLRKSITFTLVVVFFLSAGVWFERLVIWITSTYRDYLPSSWSTYHDTNYFTELLLNMFCFAIISFGVYWLLNKRKKLPFPSIILSYSLPA
jgi:multisubunit Na+/H+ antiporter MnhB subunit